MSNYLRRNFQIKLNRSESVSLLEDRFCWRMGSGSQKVIGIPKRGDYLGLERFGLEPAIASRFKRSGENLHLCRFAAQFAVIDHQFEGQHGYTASIISHAVTISGSLKITNRFGD